MFEEKKEKAIDTSLSMPSKAIDIFIDGYFATFKLSNGTPILKINIEDSNAINTVYTVLNSVISSKMNIEQIEDLRDIFGAMMTS